MQGATALGIAAQENRIMAAKLLLRYGADADTRDCRGRKPADVATALDHSAVLDVLQQPSGSHHRTTATTDSGVMMISCSRSSGGRSSSKADELVDSGVVWQLSVCVVFTYAISV